MHPEVPFANVSRYFKSARRILISLTRALKLTVGCSRRVKNTRVIEVLN